MEIERKYARFKDGNNVMGSFVVKCPKLNKYILWGICKECNYIYDWEGRELNENPVCKWD